MERITLRAENGTHIEAKLLAQTLSGNILLHETCLQNKHTGEGRTYSLTHGGTMFAICTGILRRADAERLMEDLDSRFDWNFRSIFSPKCWALGKNQEFLDALNAVRRYGGRFTSGHDYTYRRWLREFEYMKQR